MKNVLNAAKLDFCLVRPYLKGFRLSLVMAVALVVINRSLTFGVTFTVIISTMLIAYPFSISENNGVDKLYGVLPVSKKHLVIGRYLYTCLIGLLIPLLASVIYSILLRILGVTVSLPEICAAAVLGLAVFSFYTAFQLPGFYKYGSVQGKAFMYVPLICYGILMFALFKFDSAMELAFAFITGNPVVTAIAVLLICAASYWLSILVSIRVVQNKGV